MRRRSIASLFFLVGLLGAAASVQPAELTEVSPKLVSAASAGGLGGTLVTVKGRSLDDGMSVAVLDGRTQKPFLSQTFDSRTGTISGRVPHVDPGTYDVVLLSTRGLTTLDTLKRAVEVALPPVLTGVVPGRVSRLGGTPVVIEGDHFVDSTVVHFGRHPVANLVASAGGKQMTGVAPALEAGEADGPYMVEAEDTRGTARLPNGVTFETPADPLLGSIAKLRGSSKKPVSLQFSHGLLRHIRGRFTVPGPSAPERAKNFLMAHADLFGIVKEWGDPHVRRVSPVEEGIEHVVFQQSYRGIPFHGGKILVALRGSDVLFTVGKLITWSARLDAKLKVSQGEAETIARKALGLPKAPVIGLTRLEVFDLAVLRPEGPPEPTLAWRVTLAAADPMRVYVDAIAGVAFLTLNKSYESSGSFHGFDYDLYDAENEATAASTSCFELASNTHAASEGGFDNGFGSVTEASVAHFAMRNTYKYYHDKLKRHSYDDDSAYFEVYFNSTAPNAKWVPWPCNLFEMRNGFADQEVITHEFTHGIIRDESDLEYSMESGALNEHYADMMAVILDRMLDQDAGATPNWTLAENRTSGAGALRNMNGSPRNHYNLLDLTQGCNGTFDNGGVHCNSGIGNQASFLMVEGSNVQGNTTQGGLSLTKLMRINYAAIKYLPDDAQYIDARNYEVAVSEVYVDYDMHGFTPLDVCRVKSAWAVVGLGPGDFDCDGEEEWNNPDADSDRIPDARDNCVNVANLSQANMDYDQFGDACDDDIDGDGWKNSQDGCPTRHCLTQWAPCNDYDGDGWKDNHDNCPEVQNTSQADLDDDGVGDICEPDSDRDGVDEDHDNCPSTYNPLQENADGDFFGDACDKCPNVAEVGAFMSTPFGAAPFQPDSDDDGIPDACDGSYRVDGRPGWQQAALSEGNRKSVEIEGLPGTYASLPFELCPHGDCPEWFEPNFRFQLHLEGGGEAAFWVSDGGGNTVARSAKGSHAAEDLVFQPLGGESYKLNVYFKKAFPGGMLSLDAHLVELSAGEPGKQFRRADANGDGAVDISDAVRTFGFLFLGADVPRCLDAADSNDDGSLDITDGVFMLSNLFQGGAPIPAPGKDLCGVDSTPAFGCEDYPNC